MKYILIWIIRLYQIAISPFFPPSCRFYPTCSVYFIEALKKRGFFTGIFLGIWRILRCNPLSKGGFDPVPERNGCNHNHLELNNSKEYNG
ncbi:MAG: membrane protein insertion efficiency factor YidD [Ignavibacteriae bacterium]|nr:membrane protein insertion efficiency factor YidD [Ignavibacteriota bacterium]